MTGNLDTYLLLKELERDSENQFRQDDMEDSESLDAPTH